MGADPAGTAACRRGPLGGHHGVHGIADTSQLVVTSDARLSDARHPEAHATHENGGPDELALDALQVTSGTVGPHGSALAQRTARCSCVATTRRGLRPPVVTAATPVCSP